jgi:hypothetical protein
VSQEEVEDLEKLLDDQNSDSSDYDDEITYQTILKIKPYKLTETSRYRSGMLQLSFQENQEYL